MSTLRVIELFAGIGAQAQALEDLSVDHEVVAISEIDSYADTVYRALHNPGVINLGDITKIKSLPLCDLLTYSFPCQDISPAGKMQGLVAGRTRSGLLYEVERLLCEYESRGQLPKYLMLENVKNLVGTRFKSDFEDWVLTLELMGYKTYWQILNAKNYGVPQNRERVIAISVLSDNGGGLVESYKFPEPQPLNVTFRDCLEKEVDEKYYIPDEQFQRIMQSTFNQERCRLQQGDTAGALLARDYKDPKLVQVGKLVGGKWDRMHAQSVRVYSEEGIAPTLHTNGGGNLEAKVMVAAIRGRTPKDPDSLKHTEQRLEINPNDTMNALTTVHKDSMVLEVDGVYTGTSPDFTRPPLKGLSRTLKAKQHDAGVVLGERIRKLTPLEYWRLMGFSDKAYWKAKAALNKTHYKGKDRSASQLYKQAGNSIPVPMLRAVFEEIKDLERLW